MKEIKIKTSNEPFSAIEITDIIQKEVDIQNGLVMLYSPCNEVNIFEGELDEVLPKDYHRTTCDLLRDGRPFVAENGEAYTFNFLHTKEKIIPIKNGEIDLGRYETYKIQRIFLLDATGCDSERTIWMFNFEEKK